MVMHEGELLNSKTEWFSPSIVRTTIEKGGVEMAYKPARGFRQATSRNYSTSNSQPVGRTEGSCQPSSIQPAETSSQPAVPVMSAREERLRRRNVSSGIHQCLVYLALCQRIRNLTLGIEMLMILDPQQASNQCTDEGQTWPQRMPSSSNIEAHRFSLLTQPIQ